MITGALDGRRVVGLGERPAEHRLHAERRKHSMRNEQRARLLRIADAGYAGAAIAKHANVLQRLRLVAIGEVHRHGHPDQALAEPRRRVRKRDEPVRVRIRQRLQQHGVHDAEDRRRRA
jgi:hypothetical protein